MIVSVASGKGGTGKTTVAVSLAIANGNAMLIDSDVEEPNSNILLRSTMDRVEKVSVPIPKILQDKCTFCGECADFCAFNALAVVKGLKVFHIKEICKSCGGCIRVCRYGAIVEEDNKIGEISFSRKNDVDFVEGRLKIGQASVAPLIKRLMKNIPPDRDVIIDCPPGAAHAMKESVRPADFLILVTEPTPFGYHDLKEALVVADKLGKKTGIIINRSDIGDRKIHKLAGIWVSPYCLRYPLIQR